MKVKGTMLPITCNRIFSIALIRSTTLIKFNIHLRKANITEKVFKANVSTHIKRYFGLSHTLSQQFNVSEEVSRFAPDIPVDEATTPPSSW